MIGLVDTRSVHGFETLAVHLSRDPRKKSAPLLDREKWGPPRKQATIRVQSWPLVVGWQPRARSWSQRARSWARGGDTPRIRRASGRDPVPRTGSRGECKRS